MSNLAHSIRFGVNIDPLANAPGWPVQAAQAVEERELDFVTIQDHPYSPHFLDMWTTLVALALSTKRLRLFPNVANLPMRPPATLAKAVATLDVLSGGRIELGLGAGAAAFVNEIAAMGGSVRTPGEAVAALEEAIRIIRSYWRGNPLSFAGKHYAVKELQPGPLPAHPVGIYLGALGPRMLSLTGRLADGWIPSSLFAPSEQLPEMSRRIDEAALAAGRKISDIRRIYNVMGRIVDGPVQGYLIGPVHYWIDELTRLAVELGIDTFIYWPYDDHLRQYLLFVENVVPRVREAVKAICPSHS